MMIVSIGVIVVCDRKVLYKVMWKVAKKKLGTTNPFISLLFILPFFLFFPPFCSPPFVLPPLFLPLLFFLFNLIPTLTPSCSISYTAFLLLLIFTAYSLFSVFVIVS
jgi:hypothetical protein